MQQQHESANAQHYKKNRMKAATDDRRTEINKTTIL